MKILKDLFLDELADIYDAERQTVKALPKMAKAATDEQLKSAFLEHLEETKGHVERLTKIFDKLGSIRWDGFSNQELASITAPMLLVLGDYDFVRLEHAVETVKRMANAELAVIPSASHFVLFSEPERVIPIVLHFLGKPERGIPLATAETGYRPGETR